ncbi:MAG: hypothetical protein KF789_09545 [Bdellovibrionaceae bacterium]|nr:hypothetical protein [Pseudobdellovibrionaceae bacterium]
MRPELRRLFRDVIIVSLIVVPLYMQLSGKRQVQRLEIKTANERIEKIDNVLFQFRSTAAPSVAELSRFKSSYTNTWPQGQAPSLLAVDALSAPNQTAPDSVKLLEARAELLEEKVGQVMSKVEALENSQWPPWIIAILIPMLLVVLNPVLNDLGLLLQSYLRSLAKEAREQDVPTKED